MSESEIIKKLRQLGVEESEIPTAMQGVGQVIIGKALVSLFSVLPQAERDRVVALSPEALRQYFDEHPELLRNITQAKFDTIHDDTWQEYFSSIA